MADDTIINNLYDKYAKLSYIDNKNFSGSFSPVIIDEAFIPCDNINKFLSDTLFYLHLYNSLYLALYKQTDTDKHDISKFKTIIKNLKITMDYSTNYTTNGDIGELNTNIFTFKCKGLNLDYNDILYKDAETKNVVVVEDDYNITNIPNLTDIENNHFYRQLHYIDGNDKKTGRKNYVYMFNIHTIDVIKKSIKYNITLFIRTRGVSYEKYTGNYFISFYAANEYGLPFYTKDIDGEYIEYHTKLDSPINYNNLETISSFSGDLYIKYEDTYTEYKPDYTTFKKTTTTQNIISAIQRSNTHYNSYITVPKYTNFLPILSNIQQLETADISYPSLSTTANISNLTYKDEASSNSFINTYDEATRTNKLQKVLHEILNTTPENMMGYLLYHKINYNIIAYNTSIQMVIRNNYLNNSISTILNNSDYFTTTGSANKTELINAFNNMKDNVVILHTKSLTMNNNDYIEDKYKYTTKIENLNDIREDYKRLQNALNETIRNYNKYMPYYLKVKKYATYIDYFLNIIIILTILLSIFSSISIEIKTMYYGISFVLLLIITYIFYVNFKDINIEEHFTNRSCGIITYDTKKYVNTKNHIALINDLTVNINNYNESIKKFINDLRNNIYTIGNKIFSYDANNYLKNLYLNKVNQNEVNRLKNYNIKNRIEGMKKHVIYMFNKLILTSTFLIILIFGLLLYSLFPFLVIYIIILCIVLIIIIMIYFIIAIVQPTRMIADKNYWANNNPTEDKINKL